MVSCVFGTKIYLKSGKIFNGQIRGKSDSQLFIYSPVSDSYFGVNIVDLQKILAEKNSEITRDILKMDNFENDINFNKYFDVSEFKDQTAEKIQPSNKSKKKQYKLDPRFAFISLSLLALSWDYFTTASDLNDSISEFKELGLSTNHLKKEKNRKNILGATFAVSAIFTAVLTINKVEIKASPTSVSLGYGF